MRQHRTLGVLDSRTASPFARVLRTALGCMGMKGFIVGFLTAAMVVSAALWWYFNHVALDASFYVLPVATCVAALLMLTTSLLVGCAVFYALAEGIVYGQHLQVTSQPSYTGSPGEAMGLALLALTTVGLVPGSLVNLALRFAWRKWRSAQQAFAADALKARAAKARR